MQVTNNTVSLFCPCCFGFQVFRRPWRRHLGKQFGRPKSWPLKSLGHRLFALKVGLDFSLDRIVGDTRFRASRQHTVTRQNAIFNNNRKTIAALVGQIPKQPGIAAGPYTDFAKSSGHKPSTKTSFLFCFRKKGKASCDNRDCIIPLFGLVEAISVGVYSVATQKHNVLLIPMESMIRTSTANTAVPAEFAPLLIAKRSISYVGLNSPQ